MIHSQQYHQKQQQILICHEDLSNVFATVDECIATSITPTKPSLIDSFMDDLSMSSSSNVSGCDCDVESTTSTSCKRSLSVRFADDESHSLSLTTVHKSIIEDDHDVPANTLWYCPNDYQRFKLENTQLVQIAKNMLDNGYWHDDGYDDNDMFCIRGLEKKVWDDMKEACRTSRRSVVFGVLFEQKRQRLFHSTQNEQLICNASRKYSEECQYTARTLGLNDETEVFCTPIAV